MDPFRPWALWRRIMYGSGFASVWVLVGVLIYFTNYYEPANCFDGILNGDEVTVDAGGSCVRISPSQVIAPTVVWAEAFEITPGQYNAAAYVDNRNLGAGTPELAYTFVFYNDGVIIGERTGVTALPPNSTYPVFEGRIFTDGRVVTDTRLTLQPVDLWLPVTVGREQFRTVDLNLQNVDTQPQLDVTLENLSLDTATDVEVVATIFNDAGKAVTASETFIESFGPRRTQDITFTWPNSIAKTVRSCSIPTDVVLGIDLSGSMNNDQSDPPQPVTDALAAASSFVQNLNDQDQVGVVTFATESALAQSLTVDHDSTATLIENLVIDPASETGFTNTSAAITQAINELSSTRHNDNARRAIVLLTDGLPTAEDGVDAIALAQTAAQSAAENGADVYVIGLGAAADQEFIESLASNPGRAYVAPSRSDLAQIYTKITDSLCEVGPTKIEVLTKTKGNFAPVR